jgi:hypothetical protein
VRSLYSRLQNGFPFSANFRASSRDLEILMYSMLIFSFISSVLVYGHEQRLFLPFYQEVNYKSKSNSNLCNLTFYYMGCFKYESQELRNKEILIFNVVSYL